MIFYLFCALKTLLCKLENLWYLWSKRVNFDAQKWFWCTKKVKNHRLIGEKMNIARFVRNIVKWDFSSNFQTFDISSLILLFSYFNPLWIKINLARFAHIVENSSETRMVWKLFKKTHFQQYKQSYVYFNFAYQSLIFDLFCASKSFLSI